MNTGTSNMVFLTLGCSKNNFDFCLSLGWQPFPFTYRYPPLLRWFNWFRVQLFLVFKSLTWSNGEILSSSLLTTYIIYLLRPQQRFCRQLQWMQFRSKFSYLFLLLFIRSLIYSFIFRVRQFGIFSPLWPMHKKPAAGGITHIKAISLSLSSFVPKRETSRPFYKASWPWTNIDQKKTFFVFFFYKQCNFQTTFP